MIAYSHIEITNCPEITIRNDFSNFVIPCVNQEEISYPQFFEEYMLKNTPCVIRNVADSWECSKKWVADDKINYEWFTHHYGDLEAPVADCNAIEFNSHCKKNISILSYMEYLQSSRMDLLYLKDWHLKRCLPEDNFYEIPYFFSSDWLNEYAQDNNEDDFMFVYIGAKNTWTPLHVDVYTSYSWSVNVVGKKRWLFFPPGEEGKLKDNIGNLPLSFVPNEKSMDVRFMQLVQEAGDAVFVPSGWHHQVENLLDTISINHNWANGCNIAGIWSSLQDCLKSVEQEIADLKSDPEYSSQCQLILKSLFGMNYESFIKLISYIGNKRLSMLHGNSQYFNKFTLGLKHTKFDLTVILNLIKNILNKDLTFFEENHLASLKADFIALKYSIEEALRDEI